MSELAMKLKESRFTPEARDGFVIGTLRDDLIEARYVRRLEFTETVIDPFGNELLFDRVEFKQSSFRASERWPGLELFDPPRSAQDLLNELSGLLDFSAVICPITVDVLAWADAFQNMVGWKSIVDSLQIGSLELDTGITATAVVKGGRDVRSAVSAVTKGRKFVLEKIQLRLNPGWGTAVLTSSGTAKLSAEAGADYLVSALRESLAEACRPVKTSVIG